MSLKKTKISPPVSVQDFPIVGIGASAGGLDAFRRFLKAIPENSGMAYVLVQHLDPTHDSILPEILAKVTTIPVNEITNDIHLAPNNIYVIPQNKTLKSVDGVLKLTPRDKIKPNLPIDVFFTSLAEVHLNLAVGVVLSGNGKDGTLGLAAIKEHGGITFAQDEESSSYEGMPQNAINADVVDYILAPEKIPQKLLQIIQDTKSSIKKTSENDQITFKTIILILRQRSGVDFTNYKQTTVHRRILRRMEISKKDKLSDYLKILIKDKDEQDMLFQDMLIPVTAFFRDPDMFQTIAEKVLPTFLKNKLATEPIRMWVAGCSTGEEAYSFAILLHEHLGKKISGRQIQIFASDISEQAINKARTGIYSKAELKNISDDLLTYYFKKTNEGYLVNRQIRDMCVFAVHNFLKDPPFAKMGLISCRNVLIYMDSFLQKKALSTFHYALKDTGFLFLGKSETTGAESELFTPFAKTAKIYSRKAVSNQYIPTAKTVAGDVLKIKDKKIVLPEIQQTDFRKLTESMLLSDFTPASVVINEQMDIVHIHGIITPFLEQSQGKPTFNLLKMAREGLAFELRNTLHKAKSTQTTVSKKGIPAKINGKNYLVSITIIPLPNTVDPHFLILFRKTLVVKKTNTKGDSLSDRVSNNEILQRIGLEKELAQTREDMRAITEEQEAANEELQSANEELLSSSEELQSLNEELETSKEETQSSNEELMIVNQELLDKQEQINSSRLYAEAVITTVREPLVILDNKLRIKTANNSFYTKFNITEQESEGELIYEINEGLFDNTLLRSLLEKILPKRTQLNDYEIIIDLPPFGECTMLLNARQIVNEKNKEQLILIAIEDINERRILEKRKKEFSEELESKVKERTLQLEQINLQLDQFTHTTSHEFQEPLRKIATFSKILQDNKSNLKPELVQEYLNKIEGASIRMTKLTQDMLSFAGVASHEKLFIKTDLNEILRNILFDFELLIEEKKAKIIRGKLPEIEAVPFQMNQLFYDIIHNALKFSKRDVPPVIEITSHKLSKEKIKSHPKLNQKLSYYEIIFKDNGIGFDQKYERQIFTMFQRLSTGGNYPGTGIGLALCKKIVQTFSGQIFAQGKENKGASFHVILPIEQPLSDLVEKA
jgi:two-component system CheB/CheR fusion protein